MTVGSPEGLASFRRLYHPPTQANSFSLDGFPALRNGKDWTLRLREFIAEKGVLGMTTNQTLFRQLLETGALDRRMRSFKAEGRAPEEIYRILYNEAATEAARLFRAVHAQWPWEGRVSQEASALLTELEPLVRDVQRIAGAMTGVGAFTKIPNLRIGPQAIQRAVAGGQVHPNVTLVFSDRHYLDTVEGYLEGLSELADRLRAQGTSQEVVRKHLDSIHSVNSLFVSRVDRVVDPMIEEALRTNSAQDDRKWLELLKGKTAVAQGKKVYQMFEAIFLGTEFPDPEGLYAGGEGPSMIRRIGALHTRFGGLKRLGAHPQRLLIASSGVKSDQPYSPLLYVLPFLGPWCANTLPETTLEKFAEFVGQLSEAEAAALRTRKVIGEPLPALPTDVQPTRRWDQAVLMTSELRRREGIGELTADQVLEAVHRLVLEPKGTDLRQVCDSLRDKGAEAFTADERATLQAIQTKLQTL